METGVEREQEPDRFAPAIDVATRLLNNIETVVYGKREEVQARPRRADVRRPRAPRGCPRHREDGARPRDRREHAAQRSMPRSHSISVAQSAKVCTSPLTTCFTRPYHLCPAEPAPSGPQPHQEQVRKAIRRGRRAAGQGGAYQASALPYPLLRIIFGSWANGGRGLARRPDEAQAAESATACAWRAGDLRAGPTGYCGCGQCRHIAASSYLASAAPTDRYLRCSLVCSCCRLHYGPAPRRYRVTRRYRQCSLPVR